MSRRTREMVFLQRTIEFCLHRFVHLAVISVAPLTCWSQSSLEGPGSNRGASSQAQNEDVATLEEVVVTAQKREERLIDVPMVEQRRRRSTPLCMTWNE